MASIQEPYRLRNDKRVLYDRCVSVHVSECGCHFAALLHDCRLLVVYDFEKASNMEELHSQTLDIQIASHGLHESVYLAFNYGKISVVTTNGVFIIEVDKSSLGNMSTEAPVLTFSRVLQFTHEPSLAEVSCLMMSDTRLYLNWDPNTLIAYEDEDEGEEENWLEDGIVGFANSNMAVTLPHHIDQPQSSVFSVNFAGH